MLRQGQVVRVEVVLRIVPAGNTSILRTDMRSVTILNTDIAMVSAALYTSSIAEKLIDSARTSRYRKNSRGNKRSFN